MKYFPHLLMRNMFSLKFNIVRITVTLYQSKHRRDIYILKEDCHVVSLLDKLILMANNTKNQTLFHRFTELLGEKLIVAFPKLPRLLQNMTFLLRMQALLKLTTTKKRHHKKNSRVVMSSMLYENQVKSCLLNNGVESAGVIKQTKDWHTICLLIIV